MVFPTAEEASPETDGPYWMHLSERIKWMNDIHGKKKQGRKLKVAEAKSLLQQHNLPTEGLKPELENRLKKAGLPIHHVEIEYNTTSKQVTDVIEGWAGKAKGKKQVLWERKQIDPWSNLL
mmetsp:Transcript_24149/g.69426  ORF Transcript_24149/g.69426 Transcript_24149/m.69426 type:complete len:121 (-) Transcript_24149:229-591(-)